MRSQLHRLKAEIAPDEQLGSEVAHKRTPTYDLLISF